MNKQTLKKHHFWVLTAIVPVIVLIAFFLVVDVVGGEIDKKFEAIEKSEQTLKGRQSSSLRADMLLTELEAQRLVLLSKQQELWKQNWNKEKDEFKWPAGF